MNSQNRIEKKMIRQGILVKATVFKDIFYLRLDYNVFSLFEIMS